MKSDLGSRARHVVLAMVILAVSAAAVEPAGADGAPSVPSAPTIGSATAGYQQATVSWTAPPSDDLAPITGYVVTPYIGYYPLPPTTFSSTATTQTVTGLTNGTQYRFRVQAMNAAGTGAYSRVTNPVVPTVTVPGPPTIIRNATSGDQQAAVTWTAPALDGGSAITGYVVTPYIGYFPLPPQTFASSATTQTVTGLSNGTTYRFRVQAVNAIGASGYSRVSNPITAGDALPGFFSGVESFQFVANGCAFVHQTFDASVNAFGDYTNGSVSLDGCATIVGEYQFTYDGSFTFTQSSGAPVTGTAAGPVYSGSSDARDFHFILTPVVGNPIHMDGANLGSSSSIFGFMTQP